MIVNRLKLVVAPVVAAALALPLAANAQTPTYARGETISGTISAVQSPNHIFVADDRGFTDDVTFRPGATVFANGARLAPGEHVTIAGSNGGTTFLASRVTADAGGAGNAASSEGYVSSAAADPAPVYVPTPVYYPAYYPYYGYPYYGGPYGYGYGYGLSIGIGFGGYRGYGGGYHGYGGYHGGGGYRGGAGFHGGGGHR
jgi:hypothetical protein